MNIGKTLKKFRKRSGMTQHELSFYSDVTITYISLIENNHREPSIKFLRQACEAMDFDIDFFFKHAIYND